MNDLIEHQFYHLPIEVNHINFILMCSNSQIKQMLDEEISCQSFILRKIILKNNSKHTMKILGSFLRMPQCIYHSTCQRKLEASTALI